MAAKYLARCLDPSSGIPTDVTFLFHGENEEEEAEKVKAHKPILAAASAVFQREFYGSMKEAGGEIEIVDASKEVFQAMVHYIYSYEEMNLDSYDLSFIASLFYLAEKYDIGDLKDEILSFIPKYLVTKENVLEIAAFAEQCVNLAPLSEAIYVQPPSF